MDNFTFSNPTKIIFGSGTENLVGKEASAYGKTFCYIMAEEA